ncbi:MAG: PspC domain-containing protein [Firmicutes bacterium]|nr:PspC domain-containing protein [Bacillota bacterium]MBQ6606369.1 PspC domain-containing protein [Bacillota bacterium]MBR0179840.1 PspC domain-containing protein [Bacillota bacterium]
MAQQQQKAKRLYKEDDSKRYLIAGVCAGLADYTGWPLWLVRVLTVVSGCVFGIGVMLYAVAMIFVPDKSDVIDPRTGKYKPKKRK